MLALSHLIDQRAQPGNTAAALRRPAQVHLAVSVHLVCLWPRISRLLALCEYWRNTYRSALRECTLLHGR